MTENSQNVDPELVEQRALDLNDYSYELPPDLVAQTPAAKRDESLLLYHNRQANSVEHMLFKNLTDVLKAGDVLVVNNTRVIPAKLFARRQSGGLIEFLLIKKETNQTGVWQAMALPAKKLRAGEVLRVESSSGNYNIIVKEIIIAEGGQKRVLLDLANEQNEDQSFAILKDAGSAPLPPYIVAARNARFSNIEDSTSSFASLFPKNTDLERYQTIFAKTPGAVAAPTAGLHFSPELVNKLAAKGITSYEITLHVGPGTFKPITTAIEDHSVESEWFEISAEVCHHLNAAKRAGHRIIAVGTTCCRALESACVEGKLTPQKGYTSLFIKPGYTFKFIDGLVTNFHLSKSSLLLLVAAFTGRERLMLLYKEAIEKRYRFYSYGDAMLIL